ncbi:hypothetical protein [Sphingomonas sp. 1P08PE]|uniref:hypothetical protein n=1 Tax=Sphingomonas sp. 1P08PE TaxID=554122 RepID=UPI0039A200AB
MDITPNIDRLEATLVAVGANPTFSYQLRDASFGNERTGFFTVTFNVREDLRCAIGQGDKLADALKAARADAAALLTEVSVADLEAVAA